MAKITLSEHAPADQGELRFTSPAGTKFAVEPGATFETSDQEVVDYASESVLLEVVTEDAPVAVEPVVPTFNFDDEESE